MSFPRPAIFRLFVADATRSTLAAIFDEPVTIEDETGLELDYLAGTSARTITGVLSGSSTSMLLLTLSGDLATADEVELVVGATNTIRTATDGVALAPGSTSIDNQVTGGPAPPVVPVPGATIDLHYGDDGIVLARGQTVRVFVSGGAPPSITTDPAPNDGDKFVIIDAEGLFASTPAVVTASPDQALEDPATPGAYSDVAGDMSIEGTSDAVIYEWIAALSRWKVSA